MWLRLYAELDPRPLPAILLRNGVVPYLDGLRYEELRKDYVDLVENHPHA